MVQNRLIREGYEIIEVDFPDGTPLPVKADGTIITKYKIWIKKEIEDPNGT